MESQQPTKQFFRGALILTIAGLLSKIISACYRIPLQNITGDVGFYIYQQIYPFLGIALMLSLYGFPAAISKLVAEQQANHHLSIKSFYLPIFGLLTGISLLYAGIIYMNAESISAWMGDERLVKSVQMAAIPFLLIPFTSIFRGVFQGLQNMRPTAISQIIEQIVRVAIIIVAAILIVTKGEELYEIGPGAVYGALFGGVCAVLVLVGFWVKHKPFVMERAIVLWKDYMKTVLLYGLFISLNHMMLLLIQFSDAFTIIPALMEHGYSLEESRVLKGIFDRGQPLIQLGTVVGSSLALAVVPSITKARMEQHAAKFANHVQSAIRLSLYLSAAATIGLIAIFPYANILLFQNDAGTTSLRILTLVMVIASLAITISSIVQGLHNVYSTAIFILIGLGIKWILNMTLIPIFGINGSAVATVISVSVILLLNVVQLKKVIPHVRLFSIRWRALLTALLAMLIWIGIASGAVEWLLPIHTRFSSLIYIIIVCTVGACLYVLVLVQMNGFHDEEMNGIPFGKSLRIFKKGGSTR